MWSSAVTRYMTPAEINQMHTYQHRIEHEEPVLSSSEWFRDGESFWTSILLEDSMTKAHIETNRRTVKCKCLSCTKMSVRYRFGKPGNDTEDSLIIQSRKHCKY